MPLARAITLFTGLAFILIGVQVFFFHYRQNFRHWAMWLPVVASPILGVLSIILALFHVSGLVLGESKMVKLTSHYSGYSVMTFEDEWDSHTKEIVKQRLGPFPENKFLTPRESQYIAIIAKHIIYDDREKGDGSCPIM